jgi:hypothetical protein
MSVVITAVIVLVGLLGLSAASVGLAEIAGRLHRRDLSRQLLAGVEALLLAAAVGRGR